MVCCNNNIKRIIKTRNYYVNIKQIQTILINYTYIVIHLLVEKTVLPAHTYTHTLVRVTQRLLCSTNALEII